MARKPAGANGGLIARRAADYNAPGKGRGCFSDTNKSLSLILQRLDEIERKLDRMQEELRTPTAIGYSARRGNRPTKD
jgi:hypothetical protein